MTRYQFLQLSAYVLVAVAGTQLLATFAALFNWQLGLIIFIPVLLGVIGWTCFEAAKFLKMQEAGVSEDQPQDTNLPFAITTLVLIVIGGSMGVLWTA